MMGMLIDPTQRTDVERRMFSHERALPDVKRRDQNKPVGIIYRMNAAADKLGVSRNTIYRLVNAGELELVKIGARASGITAASMNALLARNTVSR